MHIIIGYSKGEAFVVGHISRAAPPRHQRRVRLRRDPGLAQLVIRRHFR
ncbi:hypothetical protein SEA_ENDOR_30 [Microbacterium phage Endor]|nr:hypothetical protein SEA_ENDOR_30 [Microbacterium phage Endor]